jgi:hypothetical protein
VPDGCARTHLGLSDDFVVDVGHAHNLEDAVALLQQDTPHDVQRHIGARVPNVSVVVYGWPARVPRQGRPARHGLLGLGEAVEEHRVPRPIVRRRRPLRRALSPPCDRRGAAGHPPPS